MAQTLDTLPELEIGMVADPLSWSLWPQAKAMLDPALARSDEDWPQVAPALVRNDMQLWAVLERGSLLAAAVTRVVVWGSREAAEIYLVGGENQRRWIRQLNDTIAASAKDIGCVVMRAYGRLGWRDILGALGWKIKVVVYERTL
ncbi:MAG: hypothetical protein ABS87_01020 [Sphingomonas sp. SCN 67-18]|nr:hypothetical protein [Sphingomonas sp. SCN 67-18]ODU22780.1 MAG: hypothetical protein ABS87_01020 [Sphingomonas sp. SCN 67-18]